MRRNSLQERRVEAGLTQLQLERETGIHQSVLSLWEQGRVPAAVRHAVALARRYGTTVEDLFGYLVDAPTDVTRRTGTEG